MCGEKPGGRRSAHRRTRITPAYAGKSRIRAGCGAAFGDHPRVCGEKHTYQRKFFHEKGLPPRMRGKESFLLYGLSLPGITPAYAGKSNFFIVWAVYPKDHPRVCGEK